MQRVVTLMAVLGVCFSAYAVWHNGHARTERLRASWIHTPGVVNPGVRQETIGRTICVQGWTRTVRPPTDYTSALKLRQMREYGLSGSPSAYQEDHLISLELGGHPTDPRNLWPEPRPHAEEVDKVENELNRLVCSGNITLAEGRRRESSLKHRSG
jgi:hypothetical protein